MKRGQTKGFISGLLVATVVFSMGVSALAAYQKQATLDYSGAKIALDGKAVTPTDAKGNAIELFAIDGTTYLPVRGIGSALGLGVDWDGATQTVILTTGTNASAPGAQPDASTGMVLMEKNGVKITYAGIAPKPNGLKGYDINLKVENNSSKDYTVQVRNLSINGTMLTTSIFSCGVVHGKIANDSIWVYGLEDAGITPPIANAEFYFHVFNSDDWSDSFDSDIVAVK